MFSFIIKKKYEFGLWSTMCFTSTYLDFLDRINKKYWWINENMTREIQNNKLIFCNSIEMALLMWKLSYFSYNFKFYEDVQLWKLSIELKHVFLPTSPSLLPPNLRHCRTLSWRDDFKLEESGNIVNCITRLNEENHWWSYEES